MYQRAPPEVNGFGVITLTPGLIRSSQVRMCLGLPFLRTNTTTDLVTMPPYLFWLQFGATSPVLTRSLTLSARAKSTMSAGRPAWIAFTCASAEPYDWSTETPLPAAVAWKAGISLAKAGPRVDSATSETGAT